MKSIIENLINGNLTDAKRQSQRYSLFPLAGFILDYTGWTQSKAIMAASYLKGRATFQAYCDAK